MGIATCCKAPAPIAAAQVPDRLECLCGAVENLKNSVNVLEQKLTGVLAPCTPQGTDSAKPTSYSVPIADKIENVRLVVLTIIRNVEDISNRVEI